mgnify:CR=1 FL=1
MTQDLVFSIIPIARLAGEAILSFYRHDLIVQQKPDHSPVTEADLAANKVITDALIAQFPWPVLSEEQTDPGKTIRQSWPTYWLVYPLDGTKEFIKGNDEFTVNIALIENGRPTLGVVYAPALDILYYAAHGSGAFVVRAGHTTPLSVREDPRNDWHLITGRSTPKPRLAAFIAKITVGQVSHLGSSLKICHIAEGLADLYPRLGKTGEWDTAAAQVILEAVGGHVVDFDGEPLRYNQTDSLYNPEFIAIGFLPADLITTLKQLALE